MFRRVWVEFEIIGNRCLSNVSVVVYRLYFKYFGFSLVCCYVLFLGYRLVYKVINEVLSLKIESKYVRKFLKNLIMVVGV